MRYLFFVILSISFFAFAKAQQDSTTVQVPKIELKAPYGVPVQQDAVTIKLVEILEDSRCPTGVDCFWQGQVRLVVEITGHGKTFKKEMLYKSNEKPVIYKKGTATFYMNNVLPYLKDGVKTEKKDYVLTIEKID